MCAYCCASIALSGKRRPSVNQPEVLTYCSRQTACVATNSLQVLNSPAASKRHRQTTLVLGKMDEPLRGGLIRSNGWAPKIGSRKRPGLDLAKVIVIIERSSTTPTGPWEPHHPQGLLLRAANSSR